MNSQQEINVTETRILVSPCDGAHLCKKLVDKQKVVSAWNQKRELDESSV